jgi:hypothetical protein
MSLCNQTLPQGGIKSEWYLMAGAVRMGCFMRADMFKSVCVLRPTTCSCVRSVRHRQRHVMVRAAAIKVERNPSEAKLKVHSIAQPSSRICCNRCSCCSALITLSCDTVMAVQLQEMQRDAMGHGFSSSCASFQINYISQLLAAAGAGRQVLAHLGLPSQQVPMDVRQH